MLIEVDKRREVSCIENWLAPFGAGFDRRDLLSISLSSQGFDSALFNDFPFIRLSSSRLACSLRRQFKTVERGSPNSSTNLAFTSL